MPGRPLVQKQFSFVQCFRFAADVVDVDFYLARQPIFDRERRVFGYELLFRSSERNEFDGGTDATQAGSSVILHSLFSTIGAEQILNGKRGFFNFDRELLREQSAMLLPKDRVVIEVLETVKPDPEVVALCGILKDRGYCIALDDFVYSPEYDPLIELAEIIKIDVLVTPLEEQRRLVTRYRDRGIRMLAEKIETPEVFKEALALGYTYFQGYFFARPAVMRGKELPGLKPIYLRILRELNRPRLNVEVLETVLRQDVSLMYRLLRYLSSPLFGFQPQVESMSQALMLIGEESLRKWFSLAVLSDLAGDKPPELVTSALLRAFFCEAMAAGTPGLAGRGGDLFLTGLFSRLDAFLDCPLATAISGIPLPRDVAAALTGANGNAGPLSPVLKTVCAYEAGDWDAIPRGTPGLSEMYLKALQSCRDVCQTV